MRDAPNCAQEIEAAARNLNCPASAAARFWACIRECRDADTAHRTPGEGPEDRIAGRGPGGMPPLAAAGVSIPASSRRPPSSRRPAAGPEGWSGRERRRLPTMSASFACGRRGARPGAGTIGSGGPAPSAGPRPVLRRRNGPRMRTGRCRGRPAPAWPGRALPVPERQACLRARTVQRGVSEALVSATGEVECERRRRLRKGPRSLADRRPREGRRRGRQVRGPA